MTTSPVKADVERGREDPIRRAPPSRKRPRSPSNTSPALPPASKKPRDSSAPRTAVAQSNTSGVPTKHGSYPNYYNRRLRGNDPSTDDRLPLVRNLCDAYDRFSVLDLGCNDGKLTMEVARHARCVKALGVDIDGKLIRHARGSLRRHAQQQIKANSSGANRSSPHSVSFPFNTAFRVEDLSAEQASESQSLSEQYHVLLCLSVTKWVHIDGGDHALERLFHRMFNALKPGGVLVLEPQPVKSYKLARQKGLAPKESSFDNLKLKPSMFSKYLLEHCGFSSVRMLRDKRPSGKAFNRPIFAFFKGDDAPSLKRFDEVAKPQKIPSEHNGQAGKNIEDKNIEDENIKHNNMKRKNIKHNNTKHHNIKHNNMNEKDIQDKNIADTANQESNLGDKKNQPNAKVDEVVVNASVVKPKKKKSKKRQKHATEP
ncbi:unnamed protein product [Agarophyton chilense]